jgi:hypothetical protein
MLIKAQQQEGSLQVHAMVISFCIKKATEHSLALCSVAFNHFP